MDLSDRRFLNRLYRYAMVLTANEAAAYDLVQDALERCLRSGTALKDLNEAYARKVMRNRHIDAIRHRRRVPEQPLDPDCEPVEIDLAGLESVAVDRLDLQKVWALLDPVDREILYLWAIEGMTAAEIAESTAQPRGTILSRMHRVRRRFQEQDVTRGKQGRGDGP